MGEEVTFRGVATAQGEVIVAWIEMVKKDGETHTVMHRPM